MNTESTGTTEEIRKNAVELYRLGFLLTGREDVSMEIAADAAIGGDDAAPFFADWMRGWQRRLVIGRALAAIRDELADSARRTQLARVGGSAVPHDWSLSPETTKTDLEQALLAIDLFPRAALLLLIFEGIRIADAATLLDADPKVIRKAQAIGLGELAANLARKNSPHDQRGSKPVIERPKLCSWLRIPALCH